MTTMLSIILLIALAACGGADLPMSTAQAQQVAKVEVAHLHAVVRPDSNGQWFIQHDVDHAPIGISSVSQTTEALYLNFDRRYTHAGSIQVSSDDDFRNRVSGYSNLGVSGSRITVVANGQIIDPSTVWSYVPVGSGNFWVNVTMLNKP